jgi:hypothetical protein
MSNSRMLGNSARAGHWLGDQARPPGSSPDSKAGLDPTQKKREKRTDRAWPSGPANPICTGQRCIWQRIPLYLIPFILPLFILISS